MSLIQRHHVTITGNGHTPMLFAHGFGCDQHMWRLVAPAFEPDYQVILFDHMGAGQSDVSAYNRVKYSSLMGYADDVVAICQAVAMTNGIFVGHSVSAMIGVLAAIKAPHHFAQLILITPSPCYLNDGAYVGGFSRTDIAELHATMDANYLGWSSTMAPAIMGTPARPELGAELTRSFCRTDPVIAKQFAQVTFLADNRADLPRVQPRCLILQCANDLLVPPSVGPYMHHALPSSDLIILQATGHCPHLSAPADVIAAMRTFLAQAPEVPHAPA